MKKQVEVTDKTRQVFVDIFCELYCHKPIEKITVQEIANKSGYNRSTFYQYFCDIYALLEYIENDVIDCMRQVRDNRTDMQNLITLHKEKGAYLNALLGDYGSIRFTERLKKSIPIEEWNSKLPIDNPLNPYLIEFRLSTTLSLFRLWHRRQNDLSTEDMLRLITCLYRGGVSSVFGKPCSEKVNCPRRIALTL